MTTADPVTVSTTDEGWTDSLNVAETPLETGTFVAPAAGWRSMTVGLVVSGVLVSGLKTTSTQ